MVQTDGNFTALTETIADLSTAKAERLKNLEGNQTALSDEKKARRTAELRAVEWKPLWAKPAIFATVILILFIAIFREKPANKED